MEYWRVITLSGVRYQIYQAAWWPPGRYQISTSVRSDLMSPTTLFSHYKCNITNGVANDGLCVWFGRRQWVHFTHSVNFDPLPRSDTLCNEEVERHIRILHTFSYLLINYKSTLHLTLFSAHKPAAWEAAGIPVSSIGANRSFSVGVPTTVVETLPEGCVGMPHMLIQVNSKLRKVSVCLVNITFPNRS